MQRDGGFFFLIFLLAAMILVIIVALSWGKWQAYLIPLISAGIIIVLGTGQLVRQLLVKEKEQPAAGQEEPQQIEKDIVLRTIGPPFAWIVGYSLGIYLLGFIIAIPLCTLIYMKSKGRRWLNSVCVALVVGGIIFGMFEIGFNYYLYRGLIWESIFGM